VHIYNGNTNHQPKGKQMTDITSTPIGATVTDYIAPDVLVQQLNTKLSDLETKVSNYSTLVSDHRNKVRALYTAINDVIEENEADPDDTITFSDLSEILNDIFGSELVFLKEYEVELEWTVRASVKVKAQDADSARSIAEDISFDEPDLDIDDDTTEINSIDIDAEGVRSCRQQ
jgi:hypothetical protein